MSKLKLIIDGGKAVANAQTAQQLGPLGIMANVLADINKKTSSFSGIKVPVEIEVNKDKSYNITIGTPSASELIKTELKLEKGAGFQNLEKLGNLAIQDVIKIADMKKEGLLVNNFKAAIKTILGTCNQMGILVENKNAKDVSKEVDSGIYDKLIEKKDINVSKEKREELQLFLDETKQKLKSELEKAKAAKEEKKAAAAAAAVPTEGAPATSTAPVAAEKKPAEKKEVKKETKK